MTEKRHNPVDVYIKDLQGNYYDINFIKPLGNDGIEIEIKRKTESYKHRSLDEYDWRDYHYQGIMQPMQKLPIHRQIPQPMRPRQSKRIQRRREHNRMPILGG